MLVSAAVLAVCVCAGISLKTQFLYALVFVCRYWIVHQLRFDVQLGHEDRVHRQLVHHRVPHEVSVAISETYDRKADSFNVWYLIGPCAVLALLINEVFWVDGGTWQARACAFDRILLR